MNRSRIQIAKPDIVKHFDGLPSKVLKLKDIRASFSEQRAFWRLAQNTTVSHFIAFLRNHSKLRVIEFEFPQRSETCYVWGDVPLLSILQGIRKDIHFSHYTAMRMLGLTEQAPHTIYMTSERGVVQSAERERIDQSDIDNSFASPQRVSQNFVEYEGKRIYLLNGAGTAHLGVVSERTNDDDGSEVEVRRTNLERTLIDAVTRPGYAGGIYEVAKAFELAKEALSVNKMMAMLKKLGFLYPYHQAIGYYLERAGYKSSQLDLIRRIPLEFDFYLAHGMESTRFDQGWRLHVPKGF